MRIWMTALLLASTAGAVPAFAQPGPPSGNHVDRDQYQPRGGGRPEGARPETQRAPERGPDRASGQQQHMDRGRPDGGQFERAQGGRPGGDPRVQAMPQPRPDTNGQRFGDPRQGGRPGGSGRPGGIDGRGQDLRFDRGTGGSAPGYRPDGNNRRNPVYSGNDGRNWNGGDGRGRDDRGQYGRGPDGRGQDARSRDWRGRDGRGPDGRGPDGRGPDGRGQDGRNWDRGDHRGGDWNRGWRDDNRYDWRGWRQSHRNTYRIERYRAPYGYGYGYRSYGIGAVLGSAFFTQDYWIGNPTYYRLPPAYGPYRWVRYYNDALLVDIYSGQVVDAIQGFFW